MLFVAPDTPLDTPRLTLEPLVAAHAAKLFAPLQDQALYRFIPQEPPDSLAALEARYTRLAARRSPDSEQVWLNWAVYERGQNQYIGTVEATVYPDATALLAYIIFSPFQRQGYAKEACRRVLTYLAEVYTVSTVAADLDTRNAASIALVEALGFQCVTLHRKADFFKGASSDEYRYEHHLV